jgi:hypothetical protein
VGGLLAEAPRVDHRHRIEYCSVLTPELLSRIAKLKIAVAPHSHVFEHGADVSARAGSTTAVAGLIFQ